MMIVNMNIHCKHLSKGGTSRVLSYCLIGRQHGGPSSACQYRHRSNHRSTLLHSKRQERRAMITLAAAITSESSVLFAHSVYPAFPNRWTNFPFSSSRFQSTSSSPSSHTSSPPPSSAKQDMKKLKQFIRPFLLNYHPDRMLQHHHQNSTTQIAKEVNLKAIQTLNGMVDTVEAIYNRAVHPRSSANVGTGGGRIELQSKYTIEFLVPSSNSSDSKNNNGDITLSSITKSKKQKDAAATSTRRSVDLCFTTKEKSIVQSIDDRTGNYSIVAAKMIQIKALKEITKLLRVANIPASPISSVTSNDFDLEIESLQDEIRQDYILNKDQLDLHEQLILNELDFLNDGHNENHGPRRRGRGEMFNTNSSSNREQTEYEKSKNAFMKSINWKEHARLYDEAMEDAIRDMATDGLIKMNEGRKQRFVSEIISRVRVHQHVSDNEDDDNDDNDNYPDTNHVDTVQQLIAMRRLSLLMSDNFEDLELEEMGKMWQEIFIVLTPERTKGSGKTGEPYSRRKRLREGQESGFKFAYHDEGKVSIHVPIDFLDDEVIGEFKRNLNDFYDLCVGDVMEQYFPKNYNDFAPHPRIDND